jgi:glutamate racemase
VSIKNSKSLKSIGLFDSGVGGLTVLCEVSRLLPSEHLIYLADTARVPYGNRSRETIIRYTLETIPFWKEQDIKLLIIACHTASSHALTLLQEHLSIPVIGVIQGGVQKMLETVTGGPIGIFATRSTIESEVYQTALREHRPRVKIFPVACPLFVPLVEEGFLDHPATRSIAEHYLHSLQDKTLEVALLACTHYPLLRPVIQEVLGSNVLLIESAEPTASQAKTYLTANNLLNTSSPRSPEFYVTDAPEKFAKLAKLFCDSETFSLKKMNIQEMIGSGFA